MSWQCLKIQQDCRQQGENSNIEGTSYFTMYQYDCRATGRNFEIIDATSYFEMHQHIQKNDAKVARIPEETRWDLELESND